MMHQASLALNIGSITDPLRDTVTDVADVVSAALRNLAIETPTTYLRSHLGPVRFLTPNRTADARKQFAETWLLNNGFQDLVRGLHASLESAAVVIAVIMEVPKLPPPVVVHQVEAIRMKAARDAQRLNFSPLLESINAALPAAFAFSSAVLSIQQVRNCLEHRRGIVGKRDVDPVGSKLQLTYPAERAYATLDDGTEAPMWSGLNSYGRSATGFKVRSEIVTKEFMLGQRISLSAEDFTEIALACRKIADGLGYAVNALAERERTCGIGASFWRGAPSGSAQAGVGRCNA